MRYQVTFREKGRRSNLSKMRASNFIRETAEAAKFAIASGHGDTEKLREVFVKSALGRTKKLKDFGDCYRMIWAPEDGLKASQRAVSRRLAAMGGHKRSWGFELGKNTIGACRSHSDHWGGQPGIVYLGMDVKNFFHSFSQDTVFGALTAHGMGSDEAESIICMCMEPISGGDAVSLVEDAFKRCAASAGWFKNIPIMHSIENMGRVPMDRSVESKVGAIAARYLLERTIGLPKWWVANARILPQGAPSSPAITNICCKMIDYRIDGLARKNKAFYSRYADDIVLSWKERRGPKKIKLLAYSVSKILGDYGLSLNARKTVVMGPGMRQSVLGFAMNSGAPTIPRHQRSEMISKARRIIQEGGDMQEAQRIYGQMSYAAQAHPELGREMLPLRGAMSGGGSSIHPQIEVTL